ncbi:MAG: thioredoxin-disulfide reductase [Acidobacteriota bacterium]|jgi:thioredoxin reductase (NADPH)|nr:thioredoxin-disulfide reductase [Acidobacteriota bacterium]
MRNVIIIGSGPAGYTSAIYTARANLAPLVLASEPRGMQMPGGQLMFTGEVENFPGFPEGVAGPELMERMKKQVSRFGVEMLDEDAEEVEFPQGGPFRIRSQSGWHEARAVIIATGANAKWLGLPDEEKFRGRGLSACAVCDGMFFRNMEVMVAGGGDTALEEALTLARHASKVTVVHRRDALRASQIMRRRAEREPKISFLWNTVITSYQGGQALESVGLKDVATGREWVEKVDGVFMGIGHHPNTEFLKGAVELDAEGYVATRDGVLTSVDGVFAAGDVQDRRFRQAITAAGFGCMAGLSAERWLLGKAG